MFDVSIIIVSWNAKEYLQKCLDSIIEYSKSVKTEIIVVDNASNDGSPEIVESKYPQVKLIRNSENSGFAKANNLGYKYCSGKFVCLINSDVEIFEDCIGKMFEYMNEHPGVGMLGPKVLNSDGSLQLTFREFPGFKVNILRALALDNYFSYSKKVLRNSKKELENNKGIEVDFLSGCFMMIRKDTIDKIGLFDEDYFFYAEDKDLCKKFWNNGSRIEYFQGAEAVHYLYGSSKGDYDKFYIQEIKANIQYVRKHYGRLSFFGYIVTTVIHQLLRLIPESILIILTHKKVNQVQHRVKFKRSYNAMKWILTNQIKKV